ASHPGKGSSSRAVVDFRHGLSSPPDQPRRRCLMERRTFLKVFAAGTSATAIGFDLRPARAELRELKIARTTETRSTCPYCAVSCGVIIHTLGDKAKN